MNDECGMMNVPAKPITNRPAFSIRHSAFIVRHSAFIIVLVWFSASAAAANQKVAISSEPAGAMVFIDNTYEGTAPLTKDLAPGTYRLKLVRKGCSDWTANITVPLDKPNVDVTLKTLKKGSIKVTSEPSKCTVFVDGRDVGLTPLMINDLPDDVYELRVQKPNFEADQQTVEIAGGKDVEVTVQLKSRDEQYYRSKIAENPGDLAIYTQLGHHYILEGKLDGAREIFKKGVDISAQQAVADADLMRFYQELTKVFTGQFKFTDNLPAFVSSFRDVIEYAIEKGPKKNVHVQRLLSLYAALGHTDEVAKLADKINAADPQRAIYREIGDTYRERGMTAEAIKMLAKAIAAKDDFETRVALGSAYHRSGRYNEAADQYDLAAQMKPTPAQHAELMNYLARLYSQKGEYDKALECINKALDESKEGQGSWMMLKVNILVDAGKCDEAAAIVNEQLQGGETGREKRNAQEMLRLIKKRCRGKPPQEK